MSEIKSKTITLSGGPNDGETIVIPINHISISMPVIDSLPVTAMTNAFDQYSSRMRVAFYQIDPSNSEIFTFKYYL